MLRRVAIIACAAAMSGCYYFQAAGGQFEVLSNSEPIDEVIAAPDTSDELARKLELVSEARQFATDVLYLPDNDSYRSYSNVGRDYVVWNVFAAPEFSLEPETWCFPVAGCVAYRGYFDEDAARRKAQQLSDRGFDVAVGGVSAYSTLGRFDDPVLNTMMRWDDAQLVATIFHELAHQELYVKGDTEFNESFATAVAEIGLQKWLESRDALDEFDTYRAGWELQQRIAALVAAARHDLEALYGQPLEPADMRTAKAERVEELRGQLLGEYQAAGRRAPAWLADPLNNARLISIGLYHGRVQEFRDLYAACAEKLSCLYERARSLPAAEA